MTSIKPIIQEFERILPDIRDALNTELKASGIWWPDYAYKTSWNNTGTKLKLTDLKLPVITIQEKAYKTSKQRTCYGWYRPALWTDTTEQTIDLLAGKSKEIAEAKQAEINITPEGLQGTRKDVLSNFCQQVLKWIVSEMTWSRVTGTGNETYQTQEFGRYLSVLGWKVEKTLSYGWQAESVRADSKIEQIIDSSDFDEEILKTSRESQVKREYKGSKLKKWSCGCTNIRAATFVEAKCEHCGKVFEYEDKDKRDQEEVLNRASKNHKEKEYYHCNRYEASND